KQLDLLAFCRPAGRRRQIMRRRELKTGVLGRRRHTDTELPRTEPPGAVQPPRHLGGQDHRSHPATEQKKPPRPSQLPCSVAQCRRVAAASSAWRGLSDQVATWHWPRRRCGGAEGMGGKVWFPTGEND